MRTLVVIGLLVGSFVGVVAQQPSQKAQVIAASFNKHKNVVK